MKPTDFKVCGFFVFNWFHRLTDRIGRYERSGGGSIPSGITKYGGYRQGGKLGLNPRGTGNCTGFDYSILFKIEKIWLDEGQILKICKGLHLCGFESHLLYNIVSKP